MKKGWRSWYRPLAWGCAVGLTILAAGDTARTQSVGPGIGIDPLSILDLQIKPNVLIVLDTSGSMRFPPDLNNAGNPNNGGSADVQIGGDDPAAKMFQAKDALNQVITANSGKVNFGFATYGLHNQAKVITQPGFQDTNGSVGPLTYVSTDPNADTWTGGGTNYFASSTSSTVDYLGTTATNVYKSFRPFNEVYSGPGCAAGTDCRRYLFSRLLRNNLVFRFNTASTTGLQAGYPQAFTCPNPPAGLFPQDPNVDSDPTTSDIKRPCFRVESTAVGNPGAVFFYTSGLFELTGSACSAAAVLSNVAACATTNVSAIQAFLKPELPIDGSCGDAVGIPCDLTSSVNNTATAFQGTNPAGANADTLEGVIAAQGTPLGGVLAAVRTGFSTYFPNTLPGQRNFVLLLTDGDESCGGNPATESLTNYTNTPKIETLVIGFGLNTTTLNQIARNGSGGTLDAFTAANTQDLVNALNSALQQTSIAGEFSDQQTITESVFEYGATAGVEPRDPASRYTKLVPLLLQSTFEMPGFVGHLNAFRNNAGASLQVWDAGDMLCKRVVGFPATTATVPASCNTAATATDLTALGSPTTNNTFIFTDLVPTNSGTPNYTPTACPVGTRCLKRRIFATARNGVFSGASQQAATDGGPMVPLWPPSQTNPGVDPVKGSTTYAAGVLDLGLGISTMTYAQLQSTFGACKLSASDTSTSVPADCATTNMPLATDYARKEAREMILAFTAGAQAVRDAAGIPRRLNNSVSPTTRRGQIRYQAKSWILADATLSGAALITPPVESLPGIGQPEYTLYKDGPRQSTGTPNTAPANQMSLGFGLRNPDNDVSSTAAASKANSNLKPLMSVVYYGANDMLHAFRAGPCRDASLGTTCDANSGTTVETGGEELYGFVPFDLLGKLTLIMTQGQDRANHKYLFATAVRFADVFIPGTFTDPNNVSRSGKWRTLMFVGRGIGGKYLTALDVTQPGVFTQASLTTTPPLMLWNRGNPDTQDGTINGTANKTSPDDGASDWAVSGGVASGAYATMGQTWSVPALARVDPTLNFNRNFVLYAGSGYGATGEGRNFYSIDPLTGDILTAADVGSSSGSAIADNVIVANPAVYAAEVLRPGSVANPAGQIASRVFVGDLHGRLWKFLTGGAGTAIRVKDFTVDQPIANAVGLLAYNGDGSGEKPHVYVEMGNDRRVPAPPATPPPPIFQLAGLQDEGDATDTTPDNATTLFTINLPDRFRGTVQPATSFNATATTAAGRVLLAATRFNPVTTVTCQSSFDSIFFALAAQSGNAAYDLDLNGTVDPNLDKSKVLTGKRINAVQVAFGQVTIDQGLAAQNAPPPPAPPPTPVSNTVNQVFTAGINAVGSSVCR